MTDQQEPTGPRLTDAEGNPVEGAGDVARAFAAAMNKGIPDPSPPLGLWWSLSRPDGGGVHVRVTDDDGRWVITDVYVHGRGLSATDLQAVPLTQLDLTMNLAGYWDNGALMDPAVIADVYNEFASDAGYSRAVYEPEADEPTLAELRAMAEGAPPEPPRHPVADRPRLTRPDGTDPDGFAALVAAAYREYAVRTRAVAIEIAREAGVPVPTARSWIREARRRGKLPQGRPGRTG